MSYWTSLNSLRQLHRFVDKRQRKILVMAIEDKFTDEECNADNSESVEYEWLLRRLFIRCLHFPGLVFLDEEGKLMRGM